MLPLEDVGTIDPALREEGSETAFTTRCRHLRAPTRTDTAYGNYAEARPGGYPRASGCLNFELEWSQQVEPELYVVSSVVQPS